jgi:hypothetical protein
VEWSVFATPVSELAEFIEQQAREAAEHSDAPDQGPEA